MKKILIILLILFSLTTTACQSPLSKYAPYVSELRDEVMVGECEAFTVTLISGERENPFEVNGTTGEKTNFTVVTLTPKKEGEYNFTYLIKIGEEILSGKFTPHPFKNSYSFEVDKRASSTAFLSVNDGKKEYELDLSSVKSDQIISASDALEIACSRLKDSIASITKEGKLCAEIFIRYIENPISSEKTYFWYVAFAPEKYTTFAVLIDPISAEVVAVRE